VINRTVATVDFSRFVAPCGFVPGPGSCRVRDNVGTQRSYGIDAEARGAIGRRLTWGLQGLWVDLEVRDAPAELGLNGNEPALLPRESLAARLEWQDPRSVDVALRARYVGSRFADDRNEFRLEAQTLVDLQIARRLSPGMQVFAAVQNLFGEQSTVDLAAALARVGPPRLVHLGVRMAWGDR
jgi:outer membrane receptor protein involved in Fe transport